MLDWFEGTAGGSCFCSKMKRTIASSWTTEQGNACLLLDGNLRRPHHLPPMTDQDDLPRPPTLLRRLRVVGIMLAVVAIASAAIALNEAMRRAELSGGSVPVSGGSASGQQERLAAPFNLIDQNGRQISDINFAGRKRLMIFAAASERDRILATLQIVNAARDLAGSKAATLACIWITTDPENDTPGRLAALLAQTGGDWTALTGSKEAIRSLMRAYFVPGADVAAPQHEIKGTPPVAMTTAYLIDEHGLFLSHRTVPPDPAIIGLWLNQSL